MATGVNVSKDVTYVAYGPPQGVSVVKDVTYVAYIDPTTYGGGSFVGEIPDTVVLASPSYNFIDFDPSTPPATGTIDLQVPLDVIDFGMEVNHLGGQGITEFYRSMFIIDTADYDGTCTWRYWIIAKNESVSNQTITLKTITVTWDPDVITTNTVLEAVIPANTTEWTLIPFTFTPTAGEHRYYWSVPDVIGLQVITGRPVLQQLGATTSLIWRPLCDRAETSHFNDHMGSSHGTPDDWTDSSYAGTFYWDPDLYDAATVSIVLEATIGSSYGGVVGGFRLYDITAGAGVSASEFTITTGGAFRYPQSWCDRHEFAASHLISGHLYKMQFRRESSWGGGLTTDWLSSALLSRAAFYIRVTDIRSCEIVWRVAKNTSAPVIDHHGDSRCVLTAPIGAGAVVDYAKNETCSEPDFEFEAEPVVDYWITDDGHLMAGDGDAASNITDSNARQNYTPTDLLPIFSNDWKAGFVSGNSFCQRVQPVSVAGDANAQWTLILLGMQRALQPEAGCKKFATSFTGTVPIASLPTLCEDLYPISGAMDASVPVAALPTTCDDVYPLSGALVASAPEALLECMCTVCEE